MALRLGLRLTLGLRLGCGAEWGWVRGGLSDIGSGAEALWLGCIRILHELLHLACSHA